MPASPRAIAPRRSRAASCSTATSSTADSEHTMSYEAGIKTVLLDRRLRFNLTGYYFKTKDLQLSAVGGGTNANLLLNADAVKGHGFEAELEARPVARPDADRGPQLQPHQDP